VSKSSQQSLDLEVKQMELDNLKEQIEIMQEENSKLHFRIDELNKGMVNNQSNNMFIATKLKQIVDKDKTLDVI